MAAYGPPGSPAGGCCSGGGIPFSGQVIGCNSLNVGIGVMTVTLKNGSTVLWTGSTDADGHYSGTTTTALPSPVTVVVTGVATGFDTFTGSATVSGTPKVVANVTLPVNASYVCVPSCVIPWPKTLNTNVTGLTLVYTTSIPGNGFAGWYGCTTSGGGSFGFALFADATHYNLVSNAVCGGAGSATCVWSTTRLCPVGVSGSGTPTVTTRSCSPIQVTINFSSQNVTCASCPGSSPGTYPFYPTTIITP